MKDTSEILLLPEYDVMLNRFKELRARLEAGLSYKEYLSAAQQLYLDYKKANGDKYHDLIKLYMDLKDRWYAEILSNTSRYDYYDYLVWKAKYDQLTHCFNLGKTNIKNAICEVLEKSIALENGLKQP